MKELSKAGLSTTTLWWLFAFGVTALLDRFGVVDLNLQHLHLTLWTALLLVAAALASRRLSFPVFVLKSNLQRLNRLPTILRRFILHRHGGFSQNTAVMLNVGGGALRSRGDASPRPEAVIGAAVLNHMLDAARPNSVRRPVTPV